MVRNGAVRQVKRPEYIIIYPRLVICNVFYYYVSFFLVYLLQNKFRVIPVRCGEPVFFMQTDKYCNIRFIEVLD